MSTEELQYTAPGDSSRPFRLQGVGAVDPIAARHSLAILCSLAIPNPTGVATALSKMSKDGEYPAHFRPIHESAGCQLSVLPKLERRGHIVNMCIGGVIRLEAWADRLSSKLDLVVENAGRYFVNWARKEGLSLNQNAYIRRA